MNLFLLSLFSLAAFVVSAEEQTIEVGGEERSYILHVPDSLPPSPALVFVLHGGGQSARIAERMGFSQLADREGFIVVYPDAIRRNWNDGRNDPLIWSQRQKVDDVGFIAALVNEMKRKYHVDPKRIYSTGASNGGIMSNRIGAELSEQFAAIAPVIGGMAPEIAEKFHPAQPVSVLIINGTEDPLVPFEGGRVTFMGRGRGDIIPTKAAVCKWVEHNACNSKPIVTDFVEADPDDGTSVGVETYTGGKNKTEVILYTVFGGGHAWPGGAQYLPVKTIGKVCKDFDATETVWEFFRKHPKP
jgi:polyhydroxybutyrate depolymerase